MSYPGHSLGEFYPSAEKQLVYSTAPAKWATKWLYWREQIFLVRSTKLDRSMSRGQIKIWSLYWRAYNKKMKADFLEIFNCLDGHLPDDQNSYSFSIIFELNLFKKKKILMFMDMPLSKLLTGTYFPNQPIYFWFTCIKSSLVQGQIFIGYPVRINFPIIILFQHHHFFQYIYIYIYI